MTLVLTNNTDQFYDLKEKTFCNYVSITGKYTMPIEFMPLPFQISYGAKKVVILPKEFRGACDFWNSFGVNVDKIKHDIMYGGKFTKLFSPFEVEDLERYLCFAFIRALELNKVIEVCNVNDLGVPTGTIYFKIPRKGIYMIFNRFNIQNGKYRSICYLVSNLNDKVSKSPYLRILNDLKYREILYPAQTELSLNDFFCLDECRDIIYHGNEFKLSELPPCIPDKSESSPFTKFQAGPHKYFWIKICNHILKERDFRFPKKDITEEQAKEIVHSIISNNDQRVELSYKLVKTKINKGNDGITIRYLALEKSKLYIDTRLKLGVVIISSIDNFFFTYRKNMIKSEIVRKLKESNKFLSEKVKTSNLTKLYPTKLYNLNIGDEFLSYEFPDNDTVETKIYKVLEKSDDAIKFTVNEKSNLYRKNPLSYSILNMTEKVPDDIEVIHSINSDFPVIAVMSPLTNDYFSKPGIGVINSAVTIVPYTKFY